MVSISFFMLAPQASAATISRPMQSLGLVGYWSFDVGKPNATAFDMSGNKNNGTLTNMNTTTAWVGGKIGNALEFDGVNDYVNVSSNNVLNVTNYSFSTWVKFSLTPSGTTDYFILEKGTSGANTVNFYLWMDSNGSISGAGVPQYVFGFRNSADTSFQDHFYSITPSANTWVYLTVVYDGANIKLYINGVLVKSDTETATPNTSGTQPLYVGSSRTPGSFFPGSIDEVRVYNRALSPDEIKRLYRQTSPQMNASQANKLRQGLVGMWTFDGNDMSGNTAIDRSGNANNGTLTNGPAKTIGKIGQALNFDGVDDYVSGSSVNLSGSPFTISAWIKPKSYTADKQYFSIGSAALNDQAIHLRETSNTGLRFGMYNDDLNVTVSNMADVWSHVVVTLDSSKVQTVYFNGVSVGSRTATAMFTGNSNWNIGRWVLSGTENWDGLIDEVRVYNRALTEAEIKQLYKAGSSFHPNVTNKSTIRDGLVGQWSFDGNDMGTTSARDASGAGNTGWLINGTKKAIGKIGQGLSFDGSDDYVDVPSSTAYDSTTSTWCVWFNSKGGFGSGTGADYAVLLGRHSTPSSFNGVEIYLDPAGVDLTWNGKSGSGNAWAIAGIAVPNNQWHQACGIAAPNGGTAIIYVDGVQKGTATVSAAWGFSSQVIRLADSIDAYWGQYKGLIDEVRVYNRALTPDEIKRLYNMGR